MADSKGPSNSRSSDRSSSSHGGSSSRKSGSRGGSSGGRSGSSSSKRGGSRDSDSNEGMGCCVGTKAMCSNSMNMNNCDNMMEDHGCHWTTGHECMMENNHAEVMMFGEDSAVKEAMNTQVNLSSVLLLAVAALAMHCLSKCWENRKNFEGYTPTQPDQHNSNYQAVASV